jgi:hypothetical protein
MSILVFRILCHLWRRVALVAFVVSFSFHILPFAFAQSELATVFGRVTDPSGSVVPQAEIEIKNVETNSSVVKRTDSDGLYSIPSLHPGHYLVSVRKAGFKTVTLTELTLNVQDNVVRNFQLQVGSISESMTVTADAYNLNTTDATVSTVVDRHFAENLPMNGRSFQSLIQLTPGVVLTVGSDLDSGQFSVNGQRASSNYWMVDGVSANAGIGNLGPGNGAGGAVPSFSVLGGTNSLVSVDALQEFRIQTSTYAPEFGRTPGGQVSIVTRSGTNQFHGTAFDYLRNDILDANDWFADFNKQPKPEERQNDFGGTFSGPIFRDKTFSFFSYEGLRLRLPQVAETFVPSVSARQNALPSLQPFLNAFPLPNPNVPDTGPDPAPLNASFSNKATLDAYSIRIDHKLNGKVNIFGRYDYSPSEAVLRGANGGSLSFQVPSNISIQTTTVGATWAISPVTASDVRFNYSRTYSGSRSTLDSFRGAVPLSSLPVPSPFTAQNSNFLFDILSLGEGQAIEQSGRAPNIQRQINIVYDLSAQRGAHSLKFGVDFRRLTPIYGPIPYSQEAFFSDVPSAESGSLSFSDLVSARGSTLLFRNLGLFVQDTWLILPRLTLTYGLRWDVDFAPSSLEGPSLLGVTGYDINNPSALALAAAGTPPFKTQYGNLAPRFGFAYQLSQKPDRGTVLRGGFGTFYDLATSEVGNTLTFSYPFGANAIFFGGSFPLNPAAAAPPPITPATLTSGTLYAFDPHLKLPDTLEWNVALEQGLGKQQTISASYIGSSGRRLIQSAFIFAPNPSFGSAVLIGNSATSGYQALQVQFQRRLAHGLQVLSSYTWAHSIDDGSAGSLGNGANTTVPGVNPKANRGPSDFDTRNSLSAGVTYEIPAPKINAIANAILRGWSLQNLIQARTASPVNVFEGSLSQLNTGLTSVRPDVVPGIPFYLYGPQYPGGKAFNPAAFTDPPTTPSGCIPGIDFPCNPTRQGNLGRNALRGFGATQWDFAVHRNFPIRESMQLQFRAEMFNIVNHPNFGQPQGAIGFPNFGLSTQMLGQSFAGSGSAGNGAFDPLYQVGGPRSVQLALKLTF